MSGKARKYGDALEMLFRRPSPRDVRRIQFAVTFRCNSRCSMCRIWKLQPQEPERELTLEQIKDVFLHRSFLRRLAIIDLTGGEPFLRKDFSQICAFFLESFPSARLLITTNGLMIDKISRDMTEVLAAQDGERLELSISLDGNEKTHDAIRGVPGAWRSAVATAERARKIGVGKVTFSFTLVPENAGEVMDIYHFSRQQGFAFTTVRFAQDSFYYNNKGCTGLWTLEARRQANASIEELIRARKAEGFSLSILRDVHFLRRQIDFNPNAHRVEACYSGAHSMYLDPLGNIYPCVMLDKPMGNVLKEDFNSVWFSQKADQARQYIQRKECHCLTECESFLSMQRDPVEILRVVAKAIRSRSR